MALQRRTVDIPVATGLDTGSDPKQTKGLLRADDVVIGRRGELKKRPPGLELGRSVANLASFTLAIERQSGHRLKECHAVHLLNNTLVVEGLSEFPDLPVGQGGPDILVRRDDGWAAIGEHKHVAMRVDRVNARNIEMPSVVEGDKYRIYLYEDRGGATTLARGDITEKSTGALLHQGRRLSGSVGTAPRGVYVRNTQTTNNKVFLCYATGSANTLRRWIWDPADPTNSGSTANQFADVNALMLWDIAVVPDTELAVLAYMSTVPDIKLVLLSGNGTAISTLSLVPTTSVQGAVAVWALTASGTTRVFVAYQDTAAGTPINVFRTDGAVTLASGPFVVRNNSTIQQITGVGGIYTNENSATPVRDGYSVIAAQITATAVYNRSINMNVIDFDGTVVGTETTIRHSGLWSRAMVHNGVAYVAVTHDSTLQSSYFLMMLRDVSAYGTAGTMRATTVLKILYGRGGGLRATHGLSGVGKIDADNFVFAVMRTDRVQPRSGSTLDVVDGVVGVVMDFDPDPTRTAQIGSNYLIPSGSVMQFDGYAFENGYHLFPENITLAIGAAGSLSAGLYSYRAVWEWTDRYGYLHRSAPSPAVTITAALNDSVNVTVPTLQHTQPLVKLANISIKVYRTAAAGSIYYKIPTDGDNVSSADTVVINDPESDANLTDNEALYTNGGELESIGPPACGVMVATASRGFLLPYDDDGAVWYSKPKTENIATEWSDALTMRIDAAGKLHTLAVMDGNVIVLGANSIYAFGGDGPNAMGLGQFFPAIQISSDVGCEDPGSVVSTDRGVFFKSKKGIHLLDRSRQVSYIGEPVAAYNTKRVLSSILLANTQEIRFALEGGTVLVLDYRTGSWLAHPTVKARSLTSWSDGKPVWATRHGRVFREHDDGDETVKFGPVSTPWYSTDSIQGFQRVWWIHLLGELDGAFKVKLHYNYKESVRQTVSFAASRGRVFVRLKPATQKCKSFRMDIEQSGDLRKAFALSAVSLTVGAQPGRLAKLPALQVE